mmetsp:Transcript_6659/g.11997  ORF Transcript_6659/g.11997 Transcript_6659/m.11997 type:complete len:701 (-) Transcript_6659:453-2555(-)|eukprot:CAMPEP_0198285024 /NCGR_PEP_ID=MMETSP1449-20131203/4343_1 /TAXON_ID=420275 /ORGANISM="Attheya septentrionalis, Strain CCMP2084" /LENGTH=700 /DNA_ID=CAMNT_0043982255 /DNA_START=650 /DNA_END=2752 /DNA_ORIENTATION=+
MKKFLSNKKPKGPRAILSRTVSAPLLHCKKPPLSKKSTSKLMNKKSMKKGDPLDEKLRELSFKTETCSASGASEDDQSHEAPEKPKLVRQSSSFSSFQHFVHEDEELDSTTAHSAQHKLSIAAADYERCHSKDSLRSLAKGQCVFDLVESHHHHSSMSIKSLSDSQHGSQHGGHHTGSQHGGSSHCSDLTAGDDQQLMVEYDSSSDDDNLQSQIVPIEDPFGTPIEEVYDGVHTGRELGSGAAGKVRLCVHKTTGIRYAVKCLDLRLIETDIGRQRLSDEIRIMRRLDHPNIVRLEGVYESHSEIYLVQELCTGGELFDRLEEEEDGCYSEQRGAHLIRQVLSAVRYLHSKGIVHRDLKLENFLFATNSADSELKMIDFGLSKHFTQGTLEHEPVGTPYTVAPEVIRGSYDERCDVWGVGVVAYLLLCGDTPFGGCFEVSGEDLSTVRARILEGCVTFEPADIWNTVSAPAKKFICSLLVTDPKKRPTAREAQAHPWLQNTRDIRSCKNGMIIKSESPGLSPEVVDALRTFKDYPDMRRLLCEVVSFTLIPEQIQDLRREFEKMDMDGSGEISLPALKKALLNCGRKIKESEVEEIFDAMRVRKCEDRVHWHEFVAASISSDSSRVDGRNLRLAFDRLDRDHKGYITFDNMRHLMEMGCRSASHVTDEAQMERMWADGIKGCKHNRGVSRITYSDFILLL